MNHHRNLHHLRVLLALTVLFALGVVSVERMQGYPAFPATSPAGTRAETALSVLRRSPDDGDSEIAPDASLLVQFNLPVQPLATLSEAPNRAVLQIDPPVAGTGRWVTSSMYRFEPATGWSPSTRFTVSVAPDLAGAGGEALAGQFTWSFRTIIPAVVAVSPTADLRVPPTPPGAPDLPIVRGPVPPDASITVWFNQPVDRAAAEAAFACAPALTGVISWPDDKTMRLTPAAPLARGASYDCAVAAGVPAANGGASSSAERRWQISVLPAAGVSNTFPAQGAQTTSLGGITLTFISPMVKDSVESRIAIEPMPADGYELSWSGDVTRLSIRFTAVVNTAYQLTLAAGASDRYGSTIDQEFVLRFTTIKPTVRPSIGLSSDSYYSVIRAGIVPSVTLLSTNTAATEVRLFRIDRQRFLARPTSPNPPTNAEEVRRWQVTFAGQIPDEPLATRVALTESPPPPGFYLLWVATPDPRVTIQRPFLVTRTHLTLKRSFDRVLVWALDYATGEPLAGISVLAESDGRTVSDAGRTDTSGLATLSLSALVPTFAEILVGGARPDDTVFATTAWSDSGGFPYAPSYRGSLATDRPIYRPGETVYVSGFVRYDGDDKLTVPTAGEIFTLSLGSGSGTVQRRPIQLDDFGGFSAEFVLDAEAATGSYSAQLVAPNQASAGATSFQVAEFRRPDYSVAVKTDRDDYTSGAEISATATAMQFFGAPVQDAAVDWRVTASPLIFSPRDYPGFSFTAPGPTPPPTLPSGSTRIERSGSVTFAVPADITPYPTGQTFTVEATVRDPGGQAISNRATARVHKADYYVGLRSREYVNTAGRPATISLVTIDQQARPVPGQMVQVQIVERRWVSVLIRNSEGDDRWESRTEDREVESRQIMTGADARAELSFIPDRGGYFLVTAAGRDGAGREYRSLTSFWVSSTEYVPWQVTNDFRLNLVADQQEYAPGDTARVMVQAPFADAIGLVTVERAGVLSSEVRRFAGNTTVLDFPIERATIPNVFVSVVLFKAGTDASPLPLYRSGQVELRVSPEGQRLNIALTPAPTQTGPRGTITFSVKTTDVNGKPVPAEMSLALVDEAILTLTADRTVNLFDAYYSRRSHGVRTSAASRAAISPAQARVEPSTPTRTAAPVPTQAAAAPAGAEEDSAVEPRTDFRTTAHFEGALRTDADGNGTLVVQMPDTLTLWRMTARGITIDTLAGIARAQVTTSKPLIVRPVAPRFFTAGDRPVLGAVILNQSENAIDVRASLTAQGAALTGEVARTPRIEAGGQVTVSWQASIPEPDADTGSSTLRWTVIGGGLSDAVEVSIPVYALITPEVVASSGAVQDSVTEVILGPTTAGFRADEITVTLWPSLTAALPDTVRALREYPYESADLRASRILAAVGLAQAQGQPAASADMTRWLRLLLGQQGTDGGWGWWPEYASDPYITARVVLALAAARDADVAVNSTALNRASTYIRTQLDRQQTLHPNLRAALALALIRVNPGDVERAVTLAGDRASIGPEAKAMLVLAMRAGGIAADDERIRPLRSDLISSATLSAAAASWDDIGLPFRLTTATRTTALAMWALATVDVEHPLVDSSIRWLMNERRQGSWTCTCDNALVVAALGAVAQARGEGDAAYRYQILLNDTVIHEATVDRAGDTPQLTLTLSDGIAPGENRFTIRREPAGASGRLYYQLNYRSLRPGAAAGSLDHGIAIAREILSSDGSDTPLTSARVGDIVKIRVTVLASGTMNYVQVEDYLPAGLEILDPSLRVTTGAVSDMLRAERDRQAQLARTACRISYFACFSPFNHVDLRDDRAALFARTVPKGAHEYVYFARASTAGVYLIRPSHVTEVYFPDVWGRTDSGMFSVEP